MSNVQTNLRRRPGIGIRYIGLWGMAFALATCGEKSVEPVEQGAPTNNPAAGLVYSRLVPPGGDACGEGLWQIELEDGDIACTPGPIPAPEGVDVRNERAVRELIDDYEPPVGPQLHPDYFESDARSAPELSPSASVDCFGDGSDGLRVQAVYAVAADKVNRFNDVEWLIRRYAERVEYVFAESAARAGGQRHVRWVTNSSCEPIVEEVVLSPTGDDDLSSTINEMRALGYDHADRKYLVWLDANVYCGIGQLYHDDSPYTTNQNNGLFSMIARIDNGCWGFDASVSAHELAHMLGAVQWSAWNSTAAGHCTDEYDRMCYVDAPGVTMSSECNPSNELFFDCNYDDYFHPNPEIGSYLATHWNIASSGFLAKRTGANPLNIEPSVDAGGAVAGIRGVPISLLGEVTDDGLPNDILGCTWSVEWGPAMVTFEDPHTAGTTAIFPVSGTYVLKLAGGDTELVAYDFVDVTVIEPWLNEPPLVDAGPDKTAQTGESVALFGVVTDDGLPFNTLSVLWTVDSEPAQVIFDDPTTETTTVEFLAPGIYVLRLTADDGDLQAFETTMITIEASEEDCFCGTDCVCDNECEVQGGGCIDTNSTSCGGWIDVGLCPGSSNIRCCFVPDDELSECTSQGGTCINTDAISCDYTVANGLCPGPQSIRCCLPPSDEVSDCSIHGGTCINTDVTNCSGRVESGRCPGPSNVRCCM